MMKIRPTSDRIKHNEIVFKAKDIVDGFCFAYLMMFNFFVFFIISDLSAFVHLNKFNTLTHIGKKVFG